MNSSLRDEIIQVLLATQGQSEGVTADALIAALQAEQERFRPMATVPLDRPVLVRDEDDHIYKAQWDKELECWSAFPGQPVCYAPEPVEWSEIPGSEPSQAAVDPEKYNASHYWKTQFNAALEHVDELQAELTAERAHIERWEEVANYAMRLIDAGDPEQARSDLLCMSGWTRDESAAEIEAQAINRFVTSEFPQRFVDYDGDAIAEKAKKYTARLREQAKGESKLAINQERGE